MQIKYLQFLLSPMTKNKKKIKMSISRRSCCLSKTKVDAREFALLTANAQWKSMCRVLYDLREPEPNQTKKN